MPDSPVPRARAASHQPEPLPFSRKQSRRRWAGRSHYSCRSPLQPHRAASAQYLSTSVHRPPAVPGVLPSPHPLSLPPTLLLSTAVPAAGPRQWTGQTAPPHAEQPLGGSSKMPVIYALALAGLGPWLGVSTPQGVQSRGQGQWPFVSSVCQSSAQFGSAGLPGLGRQRASPTRPGGRGARG